VLPVLRRHPEGEVLELANVADSPRPFPWHRVAALGWCAAHDMITSKQIAPAADGNLWLAPYQVVWLVNPAELSGSAATGISYE
jgi:amylosucrase